MTRLLAPFIGFFLYFLVAEAGGCSVSDSRFREAMRNEGFSDPVKADYDWFECESTDTWVSAFHAKRPNVVKDGQPMTRTSVDGTLCCGIFKGCTVRWQ